jgi:hypothetical protein
MTFNKTLVFIAICLSQPFAIALVTSLMIPNRSSANPLNDKAIELAQAISLPPATRSVRVQFARGESEATLSGKIKDYDTVDYLLNARVGQQMTIKISRNSNFLQAIIIGPSGGSICSEPCAFPWKDTLSSTGNYRLRVGLVRSEARRHGKANFRVTVKITDG